MQLARDLTRDIAAIATPREGIAAFRALPGLRHEVLGHDANGEPIDGYTFGDGPGSTLWYGFPDPGEAVGATGLLALARALVAGEPRLAALGLTWWFIPCLNLLDQPDGGHSLAVCQKTAAQEVDWCLSDPRPETTALLGLAARARARTVFPLHDEYHCGEPIPGYAVSSAPLGAALEAAVVAAVGDHPWEGFMDMPDVPDYANSTFSVMARDGLVFICEVSRQPHLAPRDLVAAQLGACLAVLTG